MTRELSLHVIAAKGTAYQGQDTGEVGNGLAYTFAENGGRAREIAPGWKGRDRAALEVANSLKCSLFVLFG